VRSAIWRAASETLTQRIADPSNLRRLVHPDSPR
jgi:hypothetical protein